MTPPRLPRLPRLRIAARYTGPSSSGNGGYTCGLLAAYVDTGSADSAVQVTLRQPPPLEAAMDVTMSDAAARATFGGTVIAEAQAAPLDVSAVDPVSFPLAAEIATTFAGWSGHPFPRCFACGTEREPPDALGLRPGAVPGRDATTACPWVPDEALVPDGGALPAEIVWAVLDCPGGWAVDQIGHPSVLGRMTAQIDVLPRAGDRCVVMGQLLGTDRRKSFSATTLYDADGRVLARAAATWIGVDPSAFNG